MVKQRMLKYRQSKASTQAMARYTLMTAAPAFVVTVGMDMESMASVRAGEE